MVRSVLVDTSAVFALLSTSDEFHDMARETYTDLLDQGDRLYSTSYVLVETSALVHRRLGFESLKTFIHSIQDAWEILWIDRLTHEDAWKRMVERNGNRLSFVDWSIIVAAEKARASIFTFDQDFHQEGLSVIPSPTQQA